MRQTSQRNLPERKMISNKSLNIIIAVGIGLLMLSQLQWCEDVVEKTTTTETVVEESVKITPKIVNEKIESKVPIVKRNNKLTVKDTVAGKKNDIEYKLIHTTDITEGQDTADTSFEIDILSFDMEKTFKKFTNTLTETVVSEPFYSNPWFWSTLAFIGLTILLIFGG